MSKTIHISTENAPQAIGTYSQAVKAGDTIYISGQIPLEPHSMLLVEGGIRCQITQVFENLRAITEAAGGSLQDIVKLNIFMVDLSHFATVNEIMATYFAEPYPARAAIQISALPKASEIEMDAIMYLPEQ